uniref:Uncharacterized protein n=1 Tax=Anguilla anguilla TaxID=7936 RepID=A0A0E9VLT3_ANGAN
MESQELAREHKYSPLHVLAQHQHPSLN